MSSATIESPVNTSQLFFTWSEQAEVGVAPAIALRHKPRTANPQGTSAPQTEFHSPAAASSPSPPSAECRSAIAEHLSFNNDRRIEKPVHIGSVMIKLLKRYGISDQEIAEGMANYARKHSPSIAS